ncbi:MAG: hypothetical protein MUD01_02945 [Chloroflexaceae bacterium]|jgi:hypothetical protein|nr:hypothetical protein [Chloroflexaceae bacterium]
MKYLLCALLTIHGLIHLMGFAKAFQLASFDQLHIPISQPLGLLWLAAALLFVLSAILLVAALAWWWLPATVALVISQAVIVTSWNDAKFGTFANLLILVPVLLAALGHAPWGFRSQYGRDVRAALATAQAPAAPVTEADIAHLPPVVQQYLRFAGVLGQPRVTNYQLHFSGALRNGPDDAWMAMEADQQSMVDPAERLFFVDSQMYGIPANAYHRYSGSSAVFEVQAASLVTLVDARGPEMDQSETVTLLNDMCLLAPATLIDPHIRWEELDAQTVRATFTNADHTVSAILTFDSSGALTNFSSDDRWRTIDGKTYEQVRWTTPVSGWERVDGYTMPVAEAHWVLPGGEFAYGRFEVTHVAYNVGR